MRRLPLHYKLLARLVSQFYPPFGWHIIRLEAISEPKTYEQQRERLLAQGNRGERLMAVTSEIRSKIKDKYGYTNDRQYTTFFNQFVDKEIFSRRWEL